MPSRKRNQGRARKGKAAVAGRGTRAAPPKEERDTCTHGFPLNSMDSTDRQVLQTFRDVAANHRGGLEYFGVIDEMLEKHPDLIQVDGNRELIHSCLVFSGTRNLLLNWDKGDKNDMAEDTVFLLFLENYDPSKCLVRADHLTAGNALDDFLTADFRAKNRDLIQGCQRSLVRFYRKRIPCSCLDEMNAEAKPQSKTGLCDHCKQRKEYRAGLRDCSRCKLQQYCSEECQAAAWPRHKADCRRWSQKPKTKTTSAFGKGGASSASTPAKDGATPAPSGSGSYGSVSTPLAATEKKAGAASSKK